MLKNSNIARAAIAAVPLVGIGSFVLAASAFAGATTSARPVERPGAPHASSVKTKSNAGVTLYGGGATLPAVAYVGAAAESNNLVTTPAAGSVFGYFLSQAAHTSDSISYCETGSGFGKKVMDGSAYPSVTAADACATLGLAATGFQAVNPWADFSGSDSPVALSEFQAFTTDASGTGPGGTSNPVFGRGQFVQIPYIAGAVAILYNNSDVSTQLSITETLLCKIADGQVTNWNQVPVDPANPTGAKYPSKPLKWVYRADSSGTTFSFSNFLSATGSGGGRETCTGAGETYGLNPVYDPGNASTSSTTGVLPSPLPAGASNAGFLAGNGNPAVVECILGMGTCTIPSTAGGGTATGGDGSIGYVEAANALAAATGPSTDFAEIYVNGHNYDPIKDLPDGVGKAITAYKTDSVVNTYVENGRPSPELIPATPVVKAGCLAIVDPAKYEKPATGYPIIAVTNLEFSLNGNGSNKTLLQALAKLTHIAGNFGAGKITSVDPFGTASSPVVGATGYSELNLTDANINNIATNCIGS